MAEKEDKGKPKTRTGYQFGTFKGVFTPSILTILGVVMYLRFGWVLGNVGLPATLLIVTMACSITFLTALALAALATNMKVGGGGSYYIISRSLGVEAGTAIGVPLFLAQTLGIAFYVIGFSEAFTSVFPIASVPMVATVTLLSLGVLTYFSADLALRTQFLVLALVAASLVSFFVGGAPTEVIPPEITSIPAKRGFWIVFAVFFPAVTGIESGIAMSGDLKNPSKSLPLGTIAAVTSGYIIYMTIPIFLTAVVKDKTMLLTNTFIVHSVARWGSLIVAGVWAAALSSAVGTLLGAPRTLQALARDGVLPRFIGRGFGKGGDPRIATLIALAVAITAIWMGDLNLIAPILTMFFLTSYGLLNLSAGLEGLIGSPSWHPTLKIPPGVSLFGAAACAAVMLMINTGATFAAMAVSGLIFFVMKRRSLTVQWGDMRYGLLMLVARQAIQRLATMKAHPRSWRPNILVLSGAPTTRWHLIDLASAIGHGEGCLTVATVIPTDLWSAEKEQGLSESIRNYVLKRNVGALAKVLPADDVITGAESLIRAYGFGSIVPNTILLGETGKDETFARFARLIQLVYRMRRNLILVRDGEAQEEEEQHRERIDIWWRGERENIGLMLALALLLKRGGRWSRATITVKTVATTDSTADKARHRLEALAKGQRMEVIPEVVRAPADAVFPAIRASSKDADLVFVGMHAPAEDVDTDTEYVDYYEQLLSSTEGLPTTAIVLASEGTDFLQVLRGGAVRQAPNTA
ncbi:MAG: amino acid permease [Kiritimatiellae bacterium]|nr:amino acid permease [Kiritimatiellia bacterium]